MENRNQHRQMKLSEEIKELHNSGDAGNWCEGWAERVEAMENALSTIGPEDRQAVSTALLDAVRSIRKIEFRGLPPDDMWVEGDLINHRCGNKSISPNPARYGYGATEGFPIRVDPDTVGQFTGLLDKNGVKIWQGDVLQFGCRSYVCELKTSRSEPGFVLRSLSSWGGFSLNNPWSLFEVIGNIHQNPNLLTK